MSAAGVITQVAPGQAPLPLPRLAAAPPPGAPIRNAVPPLGVPAGADPVAAAASAARRHFRHQQRHALLSYDLPLPPEFESEPEPAPAPVPEPQAKPEAEAEPVHDPKDEPEPGPAFAPARTAPPQAEPQHVRPPLPPSKAQESTVPIASGPPPQAQQQHQDGPSPSADAAPAPSSLAHSHSTGHLITRAPRPSPLPTIGSSPRSDPSFDEKDASRNPDSQGAAGSPTLTPEPEHGELSVWRKLLLLLTCAPSSAHEVAHDEQAQDYPTEKRCSASGGAGAGAGAGGKLARSPSGASSPFLAPPTSKLASQTLVSGSGTALSMGDTLAPTPSTGQAKRDGASPTPDEEASRANVAGGAPILSKAMATASSLVPSSKNDPVLLETGDSTSPVPPDAHGARTLNDIPEPSAPGTPATPGTPGTSGGSSNLQAPPMRHKASNDSRWTHDSRRSSLFPSNQSIVGGTVLPRDETEDVLSGAVVPPGSALAPPTPKTARSVRALGRSSSSALDLLDVEQNEHANDSAITAVGPPGAAQEFLAATHDDEHFTDEDPYPVPGPPGLSDEEEAYRSSFPVDNDETDEGDATPDDQAAYLDEHWFQWEQQEEQRLIMQGGAGVPHNEMGEPCPLLPELASGDAGRKCLVLDLDETLVHSSFKFVPNADFIVPVDIENVVHSVYVVKRPGVDEFLRCMGEFFEIVVFTASLSKYADPVLDLLDTHNVVRHRLFRESCLQHRGILVKDLSQLGRPVREVIILDNSPASYIFHATNAVPVSSWFSDPHDTELLDMCPFLQDLVAVPDVRAVLDGAL